jgi:hypothetical protein
MGPAATAGIAHAAIRAKPATTGKGRISWKGTTREKQVKCLLQKSGDFARPTERYIEMYAVPILTFFGGMLRL